LPNIIGDTIYLRDYRMEDVQAVHRSRGLSEITWWTTAYIWPESEDETRAFIEAQVKNLDPENRKFAICRLEDDRYLGHIGYENLDLHRRHTELGISIGEPEYLSKGIGTEAIGLFLSVCFEELGLHRVSLKVVQENKRGIRCYEKSGFKLEGAMRDFHYSQGRWHDILIMSILEDEYRAMGPGARRDVIEY